MNRDEVQGLIASVHWYHRWEIIPGVVTPGRVSLDPKVLSYFGVPEDLSGKRVLDVGAWDGPLSFEAEARGADVTAFDIQDPDKTAFSTAKRILGSKVSYVRGSVYDATELLSGKFNYIFFFGVYYHLKHPVLAFEQLGRLLAEHGELAFEGECLRSYWEDSHGRPLTNPELARLAESDVPVCMFYSGTFKGDDTNWFIPNPACLRGWLAAAGFEVLRDFLHVEPGTPPQQRMGGVARRCAEAPPVEHRLV